MKLLFAAIAALLSLAGLGTWLSFPAAGDRPVIQWVTDPSPSRPLHCEAFEQWLVDHGHTTADGRPAADVVVDPNSGDVDKIIIQGVAGVAGDIIDTRWGRQVRLFEQIGIIEDITEDALAGGYSPEQTWQAIVPEITFRGRQYMFPCNVAVRQLWVNEATWARLGLDPPPTRWTFEEFERLGLEFVRRANPQVAQGRPQTTFFLDDIPHEILCRSLGLSMFNETMTASDLDDPRFARALALRKRWMDDTLSPEEVAALPPEDRWVGELNLMPSREDAASLATTAAWGGMSSQLFNSGQLGLLYSGRYVLIEFRRYAEQTGQPLELAVVEAPHGGYPNARTTTRGAAMYRGGDNKPFVRLFQQFLAGRAYNELIVDDADALPPNPAYARTEAFRRPPDWPNEWGTHEMFVRAMDELAIGGAYSEFILSTEAETFLYRFADEFENDLITADQAAALTAGFIDNRIARNLEENPDLRPRYEELVARQKEIDRRLAAGEKVPADWVENPFYRRYYADRGLLTEGE